VILLVDKGIFAKTNQNEQRQKKSWWGRWYLVSFCSPEWAHGSK
jgi:hypothetical protein